MTRQLKKIRQAVAFTVLLLFFSVFIDFEGSFSSLYISFVTFFQFIPSLLLFIQGVGWATIGFLIVVVITLLVGRLYCSFLCPLGISMDLLTRSTSLTHTKKTRFTKPHNALRYGFLLLLVISWISGSMVLISILDPYSVFGRSMVLCVKPVFIALNNTLSWVFEILGIYSVTPLKQPLYSLNVYLFVALFAALIVFLSVTKGRLYCNTLCPLGTLLGMMSNLSLFRLGIDGDKCSGCGKCERHCKASCISSKEKHIDPSRCVSCFNCINSCPENCISYDRVKKEAQRKHKVVEKRGVFNKERRSFFIAVGFITSILPSIVFATRRPIVYIKNKIRVKKKYPVTPPGSRSIENFSNKCTSCYLCVGACPGNVIYPKVADFGGRSFLVPAMITKQGFCNFNCTRCGEVCPSGAIHPITKEEKKTIKIGNVFFIRENCIVITQKTECGACSEHCPTKAVSMVVENNLRVPVIHQEMCVGCGACESVCPSMPHKSIYVDGNPTHLKAKRPVVKKIEINEDDMSFPF